MSHFLRELNFPMIKTSTFNYTFHCHDIVMTLDTWQLLPIVTLTLLWQLQWQCAGSIPVGDDFLFIFYLSDSVYLKYQEKFQIVWLASLVQWQHKGLPYERSVVRIAANFFLFFLFIVVVIVKKFVLTRQLLSNWQHWNM